jgi:hypothetical protein
MSKRKTGMIAVAISIAIVLRALGKFLIDYATAQGMRKASRKRR